MRPRKIISLLLSLCLWAAGTAAHAGEGDIATAARLYVDGNVAAARAELGHILRDNPKNDAAWYYLGLCQLAEKKYEKAASSLQAAAALDPANYWYNYRLAQALALGGEFQKSAALYGHLLEKWPKKRGELSEEALKVFLLGENMDGVLQVLDPIVSNENIDAETRMEYLRFLFQQAPAKKSLLRPQVDTLLAHAAQASPGDSSLALMHVYALTSVFDDLPEAVRWCRHYQTRYPDTGDFLDVLVSAAWQNKDYRQARRLLEEALPAAKGRKERLLHLYSSLGDVCHEMGEKDKSYRYYDEGLKIDGDYLPILNNYAYFLSLECRKGKDHAKASKALKMSRKTVDAEPDNPTYLDTFGWLLYLLDLPQEAASYFKRAMLYGGNDHAVILDHYAEVLFDLGDYDRAFLYWDKAKSKADAGDIPDLQKRIVTRRAQADAIRKKGGRP